MPSPNYLFPYIVNFFRLLHSNSLFQCIEVLAKNSVVSNILMLGVVNLFDSSQRDVTFEVLLLWTQRDGENVHYACDQLILI